LFQYLFGFNSYEEVYGDQTRYSEVKIEVEIVKLDPNGTDRTDGLAMGFQKKILNEAERPPNTGSKDKNPSIIFLQRLKF
jgi:hypothetical protein